MSNKDFFKKVAKRPRDEIIDLIRKQDPELVKQIRRIEWVFANKLNHLTWKDGTPIEGRELTNEELAMVLDPPFVPSEDLTKMGLSIHEQEQVHIASDPVLWAKTFLDVEPRVYQILMLRHPSTRKVLRLGRRSGKTFTMSVMLLHRAFTYKDFRGLVMAPMKSQVELIYNECMTLLEDSPLMESVTRSIRSPQHEIWLSTGSTIRFFTTGLKTSGKSDVARGQEAHLIILDEMDYMGEEDVDALFAMLTKTKKNQAEKVLVGASTPTGQRKRFYEWCVKSKYFKEFWFPSYANPLWTKEDEEEQRDFYTEMAYRHEIEADWGEDVEGVYPQKYVNAAFLDPGWEYRPIISSARSTFLIGVDWDKFGAGPNIVVLEACLESHEDDRFAGRLRVAYRQEIPRHEFVLTEAVQRIIELNDIFRPKHIYVDRGYGDCVAPDTLITTADGLVPIEDIELGQKVLSVDGEYHKVTGKVVREDAKSTYEVKVGKCLPVKVSDTHPFLTLKSDGTKEWKNVTELLKGDYIALPKLNISQQSSSVVDIVELMSLPDTEYDDTHVWSTNANGDKIKVKRFIDLLSPEFLTFAGWYLSEGSASRVTTEISQLTESEHINEIVASMEKVSGQRPKIIIRDDKRKIHFRKVSRIYLNSKVFANAMSKLLGKGSKNKKIPHELMSCVPRLGLLLRSLFLGDGHLVRGSTSFGYEISLSSKLLIDQVRLILNTLDLPTSIYAVSSKKEFHSDQLKLVFFGDQESTSRFNEYTNLSIPNPNRVDRKSWKSDDHHLFLPVRKITRIDDTAGLIDIEVEGGESFVGNGLILHNTQIELLHKYGLENKTSGLRHKIKGIAFKSTIEMRDPATKKLVKKEMKPFMVNNLLSLLERGEIVFPMQDEDLYLQLISYIVSRKNEAGRPIFEMGGGHPDHAHDALLLACLAYTENFSDLHKTRVAKRAIPISNEVFLPKPDEEEDKPRKVDNTTPRPKRIRRNGSMGRKRRGTISRKSF